jgi:hypothetical protein
MNDARNSAAPNELTFDELDKVVGGELRVDVGYAVRPFPVETGSLRFLRIDLPKLDQLAAHLHFPVFGPGPRFG